MIDRHFAKVRRPPLYPSAGEAGVGDARGYTTAMALLRLMRAGVPVAMPVVWVS